jgi:TMEM175 potassium channel family protein
VLNLSVPEHIHGDDLNEVLWEQRQDLIAYAISFAVIGRFWVVHHRFFSSVVGFDGRLLALNLFYLGWIALFPFSAQSSVTHAGDAAAIVLYAVNLSGITLVGMLVQQTRSAPAWQRCLPRRRGRVGGAPWPSQPSSSPRSRWRCSTPPRRAAPLAGALLLLGRSPGRAPPRPLP